MSISTFKSTSYTYIWLIKMANYKELVVEFELNLELIKLSLVWLIGNSDADAKSDTC